MRQYASLRGRREFTATVRRGSAASTKAVVVYALTPARTETGKPKVGVVVSKKVGKAVVRNRVRRRCKSILDAAIAKEPSRWYVIQCKPPVAALPFQELRSQLLDAVARAAKPRKVRS